jgi:hypothetical protein
MTADLIKTAIRAALEANPTLAAIPIVLSGETDTAEFPLIVIEETGSAIYEQGGVIMRGVDTIELTVAAHSVPVDASELGSELAAHQALTDAAYRVLADAAFIDVASVHPLWIFDFRVSTPRIETDPPRRRSVIEITAIACTL